MINLIRELVKFLAQDSLTVEDVIARVGHVTSDPGGLMPVELQPALPDVREANVSRDPDNGLPYLLSIELAEGMSLTAAALQNAFGGYKRLRTDRGHAPEIIFYPTSSGSPWRVAVVASLHSADEPLDDQRISSLTFRRERWSIDQSELDSDAAP